VGHFAIMNENPPPLLTPRPQRNGWLIYSILSTFLLVLSITVNLVLLVALVGSVSSEARKYEEHYVTGDKSSKNKIAVIYLNGMISYSVDGHAGHEGMVGDIKDQLRQALDDDAVKAIILRINSPGGEVVASDAIYRALVAARAEKKIVACIDTVGASGAYYAALGCNHIMANELSITGSIGVIMNALTFDGLMDKVGIKAHTFKSGNFKDILNPTREPTEQEKEFVQGLIMEIYAKFVGIVAKERGIDVDRLQKEELVDGRIFSGVKAKQSGLVDDVGDFNDATNKAMSLAGLSDAQVVRYQAPFGLADLLGFTGPTQRGKVQLTIGLPQTTLEAGKFYFLPPYMFQ
jgi:protease-4